MKNLLKISLSLIILFSFFTIIKAEDYELIIITPSKYATIAQQFINLHNDGSDWDINGVYATVEEIFARYDQESQIPGTVEEPSPAGEPPVPAAPGDDQIGKAYTNEVSLSIIKFLRGILLFREDGQEDGFVGESFRREFEFAFDVLRNGTGALANIAYTEAKFQYLLIVGETGAAGPINVTLNGVPESWYAWMDPDTYGIETGPDGTWFPTDFFYSSPDYYDGIDWVPNLIVGRLPIHNNRAVPANGSGKVIEVFDVVEEDLINTFDLLDECDLCDSERGVGRPSWAGVNWAGYEVWIVEDGVPPEDGELAPVGATYLILSNTDTCLRVLGHPDEDGIEGESEAGVDDGDSFEIHDTALYQEAQDIFDKCADYDAEIKASPTNAWNNWFRTVVTAGGDSHPGLFSFWDEFVLADITNQGFFEGNEVIKLRHTNKDDGVAGNDFYATSVSPYFQDDANNKDCGLLFLLGGHSGVIDVLWMDVGTITNANLSTYTSTDNHIPIMVSNTNGHGLFDYVTWAGAPPYYAYPSFGEAAVETVGGGTSGGSIAFIGSTDITYSGIIPSFDEGVVEQSRFYNMDELLSYTMESFHSGPKYLGDIFAGSPELLALGGGPINQFVANNEIGEEQEYWHIHKTIFEYNLLGDPCLPVPYPQSSPIETGTEAPGLAFDESTLRNRIPQYESHGIAVDEIPTGEVIDTTVNITPVNSPSAVPKVKITLVDIRRDQGEDYEDPGNVPPTYNLDPIADDPGFYLVKVEQPGYDPNASGWGNWWGKESWICVQEVNEFIPANNILVVDDDFGYPVVTNPTFSWIDGYEDWYLTTLDKLAQSYDIWHVDYDDNATAYPGGADAWAGADQSDALMHGEVYQGLLNNYDKVIWLTGDADGGNRPTNLYIWYTEGISVYIVETLTSDEQARLTNYLNDEGRLFLSGQAILGDLGCEGFTEAHAADRFCERKQDSFAIQNEFLTDWLHITDLYSASARGYHPQLKAISGNPVIGSSSSYTLNIAGADGAENQSLFVDAEPGTDDPIVARVFEYASLSGAPEDIGDTPFFGTAGTAYYRGLGAHVFLPWGFEAIDDQTNRNEVMAAILSWLDNPTRTGEGEDEPVDGGDEDEEGAGGAGPGSLKGCFIATASYGTPMAGEVETLSQFRDKYLMENSLGRTFVRSYYRFSPYLAEYISHRPLLKTFIRIGLKPLVSICDELIE